VIWLTAQARQVTGFSANIKSASTAPAITATLLGPMSSCSTVKVPALSTTSSMGPMTRTPRTKSLAIWTALHGITRLTAPNCQ
jgi:hypothetical protein